MQNKNFKTNRRQKKLSGWHKYAVIALPYLWMSLFFFVPFLIILKIMNNRTTNIIGEQLQLCILNQNISRSIRCGYLDNLNGITSFLDI